MATLWQILSTENREKLAKFYKDEFGKPFLPLARLDERPVEQETKQEAEAIEPS